MGNGANKVKLVSKGKTKEGKPTKFFYTTNKAKKGTGSTEKLKKKKFDPKAYNEATDKLGMHVMFEEDKIK